MIKLHNCTPGHDWVKGDGAIFPCSGFGSAIEDCKEDECGRLWAGNSEYGTQVNYCPFCGYRAKVQIEWRPKDQPGVLVKQ